MTTEQAVREAKNRWARRRRLAISTGVWQPFVDAQPVREHVQAIRAAGMSLADLAAATGVGRGGLDHLLWGKPCDGLPPAARIRTETADALLNYWPRLDDYTAADAHVDATGTRRRLRALAATGWTWHAIAERAGIPQSTVERASRRAMVTAATARAIRDLYDTVGGPPAERHGITPWIAARTRRRATAAGWPPPAAWDDDHIDDPAAQADGDATTGPSRPKRRDDTGQLREEVRHLAALGESEHQIAKAVGRSTSRVRELLGEAA